MRAGLVHAPTVVADMPPLDRQTLLAGIRARARTDLASLADCIDQDGIYPRQMMQSMGQHGLFSAHLRTANGMTHRDFGAAILGMAEIGAECMSTAFCTWCQDASGWYLENSANDGLRERLLPGIASGAVMAGTGMSNPLKTFSGIEGFKLKAKRAEGGYVVSGVLPWVSNLGDGHWFGTVMQDADDDAHQFFAMVRCGQPGVDIRQNARFIALEGTGTYSVLFRRAFVADEMMLSDPVSDMVRRIKPGLILLQTGMGLGVIAACIGLMAESNRAHGHVNQYLEKGVSFFEDARALLRDEILHLAETPTETAPEYMRAVLTARLRTSELALESSQAALLHAGSRGYLHGSPVNRRLRESYFVAIITPSIRHLRKELAMMGRN